MQHLAIMKKSLKLLEKIRSGEKTIESRWYKNRKAPWNTIKKGETVYFKNSGEAVTLQATVSKVLQWEGLNELKVKELIKEYGKDIGIKESYYEKVKDKNYCILIYLTDLKEVQPFKINKKGFGNMAAWISAKDIETIQCSKN